MKTIKFKKHILIIVTLTIIFSFEIKSQVKVTTGGYVGVYTGATTPNSHFQVGNNNTYNSCKTSVGAEFRIGRYNSSWAMCFLQARDNTTNEIGFRFRTQPSGGGVKDVMHMYGNGNIVYYYSLTKSSDIRLKENISNVDKNKIDKLYKLNAVEYDNKPSDTTEVFKSKSLKNKKKMYGFIAQDVEKLLPDFVHKDDAEYLSIDYISLIPLLVEALKEQKDQIEKLEKKLKSNDKSDSPAKNEDSDKSSPNLESNNLIEETILYQNSPNPFSEQTEIRYSIPQNVNSAYIHIFDMQGKLIKTLTINNLGDGFVKINGYQYDPGMYIYTLIVNGQEVDTKRMILTK